MFSFNEFMALLILDTDTPCSPHVSTIFWVILLKRLNFANRNPSGVLALVARSIFDGVALRSRNLLTKQRG